MSETITSCPCGCHPCCPECACADNKFVGDLVRAEGSPYYEIKVVVSGDAEVTLDTPIRVYV